MSDTVLYGEYISTILYTYICNDQKKRIRDLLDKITPVKEQMRDRQELQKWMYDKMGVNQVTTLHPLTTAVIKVTTTREDKFIILQIAPKDLA